MGFVEDIEIEIGILKQNIFVWTGFCEPVFYITYPFFLKVNAGKTFFLGAPDNLFLSDIDAFDKIVALEKCTKQDYPDNYKNDAERIFGKSQRWNPS
jgi:hypothetical protein